MSCIASINIFTYFASRANGNLVFFSTAIFIIICITTIYIVLDSTVTNLYAISLTTCVAFSSIYISSTALDNHDSIAFAITFYSNTTGNIGVYYAISFNDNMVFYSVCSTGATTTHNIPQSITANRYSILSDITIKRICTPYDVSCSSTGNSNIVLKYFRRRHLFIIITTVNSIIITRVQRNISTC